MIKQMIVIVNLVAIGKSWIHSEVVMTEKVFLRVYKQVECCGADTYKDYPDRFGISPPEGCINRRHAGGW